MQESPIAMNALRYCASLEPPVLNHYADAKKTPIPCSVRNNQRQVVGLSKPCRTSTQLSDTLQKDDEMPCPVSEPCAGFFSCFEACFLRLPFMHVRLCFPWAQWLECSSCLTYLTKAFLCTIPRYSPSSKTQMYRNPNFTKH